MLNRNRQILANLVQILVAMPGTNLRGCGVAGEVIAVGQADWNGAGPGGGGP